MEQPPPGGGGLFATLRRMLDSILGLLQNRLELFSTELQEEKVRAFDLLLRAAAVAMLASMALIAATAALVVWLWDTCPTLVLVAVTLAYALGAVLIWRSLQQRLQRGPRPFADTIAEFKKDRECLRRRD